MIPSRTMETIKDRFYAVMEKLGLNDYKVYTTGEVKEFQFDMRASS